MPSFAVEAFELRSEEAVSGCSFIGDAHREEYCPLCCEKWLWLHNAHNAPYEAQDYADDVVLLQKGKFVSTLCDHMQGGLNCVEWPKLV
jgi:hypothetical protein